MCDRIHEICFLSRLLLTTSSYTNQINDETKIQLPNILENLKRLYSVVDKE
jgi:hypothetical protein